MDSTVYSATTRANLRRRATEGGTVLGTDHVAAQPRLQENISEFPAVFVRMAITEPIVRTSAIGRALVILKAAAAASLNVCV